MVEDLLCVGGPLAGSMARHPGHILSVEEQPAPMGGILPNSPYGQRTDYHTVRFYCGGKEISLWTCLSDLDTFLELCNYYKNPRYERPQRRPARFTCAVDPDRDPSGYLIKQPGEPVFETLHMNTWTPPERPAQEPNSAPRPGPNTNDRG